MHVTCIKIKFVLIFV